MVLRDCRYQAISQLCGGTARHCDSRRLRKRMSVEGFAPDANRGKLGHKLSVRLPYLQYCHRSESDVKFSPLNKKENHGQPRRSESRRRNTR